jgi:hypothetical protein
MISGGAFVARAETMFDKGLTRPEKEYAYATK